MQSQQTDYKNNIRNLSERIVKAQKAIRILDAIKWNDEIQRDFFENKCQELPKVNKEYYEKNPLPFKPEDKITEFKEIIRDIRKNLGNFNPLAKIMERMCLEYCDVIRMLEGRGTQQFSDISQQLYGSSTDVFHAGDPDLSEMAKMISEVLQNLSRDIVNIPEKKDLSSEEGIAILQKGMNDYFKDSPIAVEVKLSDGIVSDASAGANYIKIRKEAKFNQLDLRLLEIHEGWVHVGTSINGALQPYCTFLSKGAPSSTITQEGLAIITEIFHFVSHPGRIRRLTNRIRAINLVEKGANFLEVFQFFREQGFSEMESYNNSCRVFRGSTPDGAPFTKDLVYNKGFVLVYNYIRLAVKRGIPSRLALLFCGKTTLEDMKTLADLVEEGIVIAPKYVPDCFSDVGAITAWMCYSNFLNQLNLKRIELDYSNIL